MGFSHLTNNYNFDKKSGFLKVVDFANNGFYRLVNGRKFSLINTDGKLSVKETPYKPNSKALALLIFVLSLPILVFTIPLKALSKENKMAARQFEKIDEQKAEEQRKKPPLKKAKGAELEKISDKKSSVSISASVPLSTRTGSSTVKKEDFLPFSQDLTGGHSPALRNPSVPLSTMTTDSVVKEVEHRHLSPLKLLVIDQPLQGKKLPQMLPVLKPLKPPVIIQPLSEDEIAKKANTPVEPASLANQFVSEDAIENKANTFKESDPIPVYDTPLESKPIHDEDYGDIDISERKGPSLLEQAKPYAVQAANWALREGLRTFTKQGMIYLFAAATGTPPETFAAGLRVEKTINHLDNWGI